MTSRRPGLRILDLARAVVRALTGQQPRTGRTPGRPARARPGRPPAGSGDFTGVVRPEYSPHPDGNPDPGEVVWAWVPYEDDPAQGKDRPVLLVGRDGRWLLGLQLSSQDKTGDTGYAVRGDRHWMDVGSGGWDSQRRPSEVRLDRVLRVDPASVRREGAVLDRAVFDRVVRAMQDVRGR